MSEAKDQWERNRKDAEQRRMNELLIAGEKAAGEELVEQAEEILYGLSPRDVQNLKPETQEK